MKNEKYRLHFQVVYIRENGICIFTFVAFRFPSPSTGDGSGVGVISYYARTPRTQLSRVLPREQDHNARRAERCQDRCARSSR